jgi:hypothetical protein
MLTAPATARRSARWTARLNADATAARSKVRERRRLMQPRDSGAAEGAAGGSHIVQPGLRRSGACSRFAWASGPALARGVHRAVTAKALGPAAREPVDSRLRSSPGHCPLRRQGKPSNRFGPRSRQAGRFPSASTTDPTLTSAFATKMAASRPAGTAAHQSSRNWTSLPSSWFSASRAPASAGSSSTEARTAQARRSGQGTPRAIVAPRRGL